jgi:Protein of unknown function (DUF3631)
MAIDADVPRAVLPKQAGTKPNGAGGHTEEPPPAKSKGVGDTPKYTPAQWKEIQILLGMPPIDRDGAIKSAAKELNCNVGTLRKTLRSLEHNDDDGVSARAADKPARAGQKLNIPDSEPWPGAVDGASLLDEIAAMVQRFVVTREAVPEAVALWILHTHTLDAAFISPRLAITSPERRCGKTTLLILLSTVAARPLSTANITAAAIFRVADAVHPTLLVDEADSFLAGNEELRGLINAGHCRANSIVLRVVELPEGHEARGFDVWGPVAIAAIGKLPATIEDRSIKIALYRRRRDEPVEQLRRDRLDEFAPMARRCKRWALDYLPRLRGTDPPVPRELHDRAADNWRPLLAIADLAGGDWPGRARQAAKLLSDAGFDDAESKREMLLADLKALFDRERPTDALFTDQILAALGVMEQRPWPEYRSGKPITSHQLAALLKPLKVRSNTVRRGERTNKGYRREDLEDAFARYLSAAQ